MDRTVLKNAKVNKEEQGLILWSNSEFVDRPFRTH